MVEIKILDKYEKDVAKQMRGLLIQLSRSGKDKGEIPKEWFLDVISSPFHDVILAYEGEAVLGMMSVSIIMGAGIRKNAYLEDFVVSTEARGKGVGRMLWQAFERWARKKGAQRIELTCGEGRDAAQAFYKKNGAEIYSTNFFRKELD